MYMFAPIDIKRQTRPYTTWSGTHTYTPPCSMMSGRRIPLYTCSGNYAAISAAASVPLYMHEAATVALYRHAAAIAATHKRSHSCKHYIDTFQDFVQMLIASRCHGGGNSKYHSTERANEQLNTKLQAQRKARKTQTYTYIGGETTQFQV